MRRRTRACLAPLAAVAAALIPLAGLTVATAAPAAADPEWFYAMDWNIAGATTHDGDPGSPNNYGSLPVADRLADLAIQWKPKVISMNEACDNQVEHVKERLEDAGLHVYTVGFVTTQRFHPACLNSWGTNVGNALLSLVPADSEQHFYFDPDTGDVVDGRTERGGVCLRLHFATRDVRGCSMHLAKEEADAVVQAQKFAERYSADASLYPYVLLGDLNATPEKLLPLLYSPAVGGGGVFSEAAMDLPDFGSGNPTEGSRKIDYAFGSEFAFDRDGMSMAVLDPGTCYVNNWVEPPWWVDYPHVCSDHKPIVAGFTLKEPGGEGGGGEIPGGPEPADHRPTVNAGPDLTGTEGGTVQLNGSASDAESTPSVTWTYTSVNSNDPGTSCTFGDPHATDTTVSCDDDGIIRLQLTADDGVTEPVTDTATLTLANAPPKLGPVGPASWSLYRAGRAVQLTAPFTDPGANDTHTCTVVWDDGSTDESAAAGGDCNRSHTFTHPGMYTIKVTVTDDDGASDSAETMVVVYDPDAGWANQDGSTTSPAGAYPTQPSATGEIWAHLLAHYYQPDVPTGRVSIELPGTALRLDGTDVQWLVVTPDGKLAAKGTGSISGEAGGQGWVVYGYVGCRTGQSTDCQPGPDKLRVVTWPLSAGANPGSGTRYDNVASAGYDLDLAGPTAMLSGQALIQRP